MDLCEKVFQTLKNGLKLDYMHLDDDDGIIGYVVSHVFDGVSTLDRHELLENVLAQQLSHAERRRILVIAPLTPDEWGAIGQQIPIQSRISLNPT